MKKILSFVLVAVMIASLAASAVVINVGAASDVSVWDGKAASSSLSGSGTKTDPFLIQSAADLKYLANAVNANYNTTGGNTFAGKYIKQTVDIDLGNHKWLPIGYREYAVFQGVYDGDGHSIVGLSNWENGTGNKTAVAGDISYRNGLFGAIGTMGRDGSGNKHIPAAAPYECGIANLTVEGNITLPATGHNNSFVVGGLVSAVNDETVTNAKTVYITNVVSNVNVTTSGFGSAVPFGGVCGMAMNAVFENVVNNGNVTVMGTNSAYHPVGGFAGRAENCEFISCTNNGDVYFRTTESDNSPRVGGFVGQYYKKAADQFITFINCVNNGDVTARFMSTTAKNTYAGGILGAVYYNVGGSYAADTWPTNSSKKWSNFKATFVNCVNTGTVGAFRPYVTATGGCTAAGILSTTYAGNGADKNNGGFLFDSCVNVGTINCSEAGRATGIVSCVYTDWEYTYDIKILDCMTGSKSAYPEINYGNKKTNFNSSGSYNAVTEAQQAEILGTDTEDASSFNTAKATSLVNWNKTLVLPSLIDINGMPTGANVAVLTGVKNLSVDLPYTVPANMVVTDAQGNRVTEITEAGAYNVKLTFTGVTPYVTDQFALKYDIAYEDDYVDVNDLVMKFTFRGNDRMASLADTATDLNAWTEDATSASGMFHNILPRQLGNTVTMTLTKNGETLLSYDYSLVTYVTNQLAKTASQLGLTEQKKAQLDNLLVDMLKYGAEDQRVNGVAEDKLVTKALSEEQLALGTPFSTDGLVDIKGAHSEYESIEIVYWNAVSLVFDNTITMRMKFVMEDWYETENFTFKLKTTGKSIGISNVVKTENGYYVDIVGFAPTEYADEVSVIFAFDDGSAASYTLTYSVNSYLLNKNESATYGALVRALASYGASTRAFLG